MKRIKIFLCIFFMFALQAQANEKISLGVLPFQSTTNRITTKQAEQITKKILHALRVSQSISVIEPKKIGAAAINLGIDINSGILNQDMAARIGRSTGAKYILQGYITNTENNIQLQRDGTSAVDDALPLISFLTGKKETSQIIQEVTLDIDAKLIDSSSGRVVLSFSKTGSGINFNNDDRVLSANVLRERAVNSAVSRLSDKIREVLANEYAIVLEVKSDAVRINRGGNSSVGIGALYRVYREGGELFDLDKTPLGKRMISIILLRISEAGDEDSIAVLPASQLQGNKAQNADTVQDLSRIIRNGYRLEAISLSEAALMRFTANERR